MKLLKSLLSVLVALSMVFLTGCDDEDVVVGVGLIAIGATKVIVGADRDGYYYKRNRRRRIRRRGRRGHGRRLGYSSAPLANPAFSGPEIVKMSNELGLSRGSAVKLATAFELAQDGDISLLNEVGFTEDVLLDMSHYDLPSYESRVAMAEQLGQSPQETSRMLREMMAQSKAQATNVNSYLWQSCQAEGQWKTPENLFCRSTSWKGCSPATGASSCVPSLLDEAI